MTAAASFRYVYEVEHATALAESDKAILCRCSDEVRAWDAWVPKTQIDPLSDVKKRGDRGVLTVSRWFAIRAGWVRG